MFRVGGFVVVALLAFVVLISNTQFVFGQTSSFSIVSTYDIADEFVSEGDIVSFDPVLSTYSVSGVTSDEQMFGVVQNNPVVVFRTSEGRVPIAQFGETFVNVTTLNGPIHIGDLITTSDILGKGQRFDAESGYVLGVALESFTEEEGESTIEFDDKIISVGSIFVLLDIENIQDEDSEVGISPTVIITEPIDETAGTLRIATVFQYVIATIFAAVSLFLVFRNFGPNLREGVISVGRNPLAKASIQSMVTFNMLLILTISITALLVSLVIILIPI